jgi:hypothetical protein
MTSIAYSKDRVLLQSGGLDSKASMPEHIMATSEDNTQRRPAKKLATACLCLRAPPNFLLPDELLNQRGEPPETDFPSPSHVQTEVSKQDTRTDCAEPTMKISRYSLRSTHRPDVVNLREVNKNSESFPSKKVAFWLKTRILLS